VRTRKVKYVESDDEDDVLKPVDANGTQRSSKRRKVSPESEDEFGVDDEAEAAMMEIGEYIRGSDLVSF
jgi:hypothetical protein